MFRRRLKTHLFSGRLSFSVPAGLTVHRNFSMFSQDFFCLFSFSFEKKKESLAHLELKSMESCAIEIDILIIAIIIIDSVNL